MHIDKTVCNYSVNLNNIFIGFHGCVVVAESGCAVNVLSSFLKNLCYVSEVHFSSQILYS